MANISAVHLIMEHFVLNLSKPVDIFIHSWSTSARYELVNMWKPIHYHFEDNLKFKKEIYSKIKGRPDYRVYSMAYSVAKGVELMNRNEKKRGKPYKQVVITRPDAMFPIDLNVSDFYTKKNTSCMISIGKGTKNDQFLIMNSTAARIYAGVADALQYNRSSYNGSAWAHGGWRENYMRGNGLCIKDINLKSWAPQPYRKFALKITSSYQTKKLKDGTTSKYLKGNLVKTFRNAQLDKQLNLSNIKECCSCMHACKWKQECMYNLTVDSGFPFKG